MQIVPAEEALISAANALLRSLSASVSFARSLTLCSGSASRFPWFATKKVAFPVHVFAHIYGEIMRNARKEDYTVCFLREVALFGESEEDLLRGCFGDGAFQVGGDVYGAVWAVYLIVVMMRKMWNHEHLNACYEPA